MLQHLFTYHTRAVTYYLYHYDFFSLTLEALKESTHLYHILHILL